MDSSRNMSRAAARWPALLVGLLALLPLAKGQDDASAPLPRPPTPDFNAARVGAVLDVSAGDVLVVDLDGERTTLRLIGTRTPARGAAADEARAFTARLLRGESVYVLPEPDRTRHDREQRAWAYVYRAPDGLLVNLELVRQGYAKLSAAGPFEHRELFEAYERRARESRKGVWRLRDAAAPTTQPTTTSPAVDERAQPTDKPEQSTGDAIVYVTPHGKKYHRKDCQYVRRGGRSMTLAEAKAKGYTPCKRCRPPE